MYNMDISIYLRVCVYVNMLIIMFFPLVCGCVGSNIYTYTTWLVQFLVKPKSGIRIHKYPRLWEGIYEGNN